MHVNDQSVPAAALIAVDWGSTSARFHLVTAEGAVLDRCTGAGVLRLTASGGHPVPSPRVRQDAFAGEFERCTAGWSKSYADLPVVMCGMVGSDQGWVDAGYLDVPTSLGMLGAHLRPVPYAGARVSIVPGLARRRPWPDVIRGEETQVLGALPNLARQHEITVITPGTHSKWIDVSDGRVEDFATYMTGEFYALLHEHSILGADSTNRAKPDAASDADIDQSKWQRAFHLGVDVALDPARPALTRTAFTARTRVIGADLLPDEVPDYLSGLVIGTEIADALARRDTDCESRSAVGVPRNVVLLGEPVLAQRYERALRTVGIEARLGASDAAVRGLVQVARTAGLLPGADDLSNARGAGGTGETKALKP